MFTDTVYRVMSRFVAVGLISFFVIETPGLAYGAKDDKSTSSSDTQPAEQPSSPAAVVDNESPEPAQPKLRVSGSKVILDAEQDLSTLIDTNWNTRSRIKTAETKLGSVQFSRGFNAGFSSGAKQDLQEIATEIANSKDPAEKKQLEKKAKLIEALAGNVVKKDAEFDEQEMAIEKTLGEERNVYVANIRNMLTMATRLSTSYTSGKDDPAILQEVEELSKKRGKALKFGPSESFPRYLRKVDELKDSIQTETFELRREGATLCVKAILNDEHPSEMVVDLDTTFSSIPYELAVTLELTPSPADETEKIESADGEIITRVRNSLDSIELGSFRKRHISCVIAGKDQKASPAVLGQSFFKEFVVEFDRDAGILSLTTVDTTK